MSDLTYSISALENLGTGLADLAADLRSDGGLDHVTTEQVNSQRIVDALDNFADDWDDKRETLARSIESIGEMATTAAEGFADADAQLAAEVREAFETAPEAAEEATS